MSGARRQSLLLVSSSGGVLLDLLALEPFWSRHEAVWAAVRAADTESALADRQVVWIEEKHFTRPGQLVWGIAESVRFLSRRRPSAVISAGTGSAVPFFVAARLLRIPCWWVSTLNVVHRPGLAARVCGRLATVVLLQRAGMSGDYPRGIIVGELY